MAGKVVENILKEGLLKTNKIAKEKYDAVLEKIGLGRV